MPAGPILTAFEELPLAMEIRSAISMSGSLGTKKDLKQTIEAAGVAFAVVWVGLIARYRAAGVFGLFLCIVFLWLQVSIAVIVNWNRGRLSPASQWLPRQASLQLMCLFACLLQMIFFNASTYALSDAAIVAVVLNIGLSADAHIIAFERIREDMHELPHGAPRTAGLAAMHRGLRIAFITVLEANVSTMLAMVVLYLVGTGGTKEFAFTVLISVSRDGALLGGWWAWAGCGAVHGDTLLVCGCSWDWRAPPLPTLNRRGRCSCSNIAQLHISSPLPALNLPAGVCIHPCQRVAGPRHAAPGLERRVGLHWKVFWR